MQAPFKMRFHLLLVQKRIIIMVDKEQIKFLYHLQGVRELFDDYADTFDDDLVNGLRYDVPNLLRMQLPSDAPPFQRCLDLGCGTGLSGAAFRNCCGYMEGVDLSPKMIQKAKASGAYNVVKSTDLQGHLRQCLDGSFDLIISCDVLMYVYDLEPLFQQVQRVLQVNGGTFAFSTEALEEEANVDVLERESGRYAHSRNYVQRLAVEYGFELQSLVNVLGRMDEGKEIRSELYVFQHRVTSPSSSSFLPS